MRHFYSDRRQTAAERLDRQSPGDILVQPSRPYIDLLNVVRIIPWATITVTLVVIVACVNGTLHRYPTSEQLDRWGTGLQALRDGRIMTIITTNFLIDHPAAILSTMILAIVATGVCELYFGTVRAIIAWFAGAWFPLVLAGILLVPAHLLHMQATIDRLMAPEVGSSTATWCCAGAVLGFPFLVRGWRCFVGVAALALLLAIAAVRPDYSSLEHLTTFVAGLALYHLWRGTPSRISQMTRARGARLMSLICGAVFLIELVLTGLWWGTFALLPVGIALILLSLFVTRGVDLPLALLALVGGILANIFEPDAATVLAVAAVLWLTLYRGPWTLPEELSNETVSARLRSG